MGHSRTTPGLCQVSPSNLGAVFRLLEEGAVSVFSVDALKNSRVGQAKHVHALLSGLDFLDKDSKLVPEIEAVRRAPAQLAGSFLQGTLLRYAPSANKLGDLTFLFTDDDDGDVRRKLADIEGLKGKKSLAQITCSLMGLRKLVRERLTAESLRQRVRELAGRSLRPGQGLSSSITANDNLGAIPADSQRLSTEPVPQLNAHEAQAADSPAVISATQRVTASREPMHGEMDAAAADSVKCLKMQIRTAKGLVMVSARSQSVELQELEVTLE